MLHTMIRSPVHWVREQSFFVIWGSLTWQVSLIIIWGDNSSMSNRYFLSGSLIIDQSNKKKIFSHLIKICSFTIKLFPPKWRFLHLCQPNNTARQYFYLCFLIHYDQSEFALMFIQKISSTFRNFNPRIIYKPWPREYKKNVSLYFCAALQMILRKPPLALVKFWCTSLRTEIFILIWSWYC